MAKEQREFSEASDAFLRRLLHSTRGIRYGRKTGVKTASEVGLRKVRYFRGCDFYDHLENVTQDGSYVDKRLEVLSKEWLGGHLTSEEVGTHLLADGLISAAVYKPLNEKIRRFPDRLVRTESKLVERDGFYIVNIEERDKFMALKIAALITTILAIVMFPAWPFWLKVGLWYSLVMFLFGLLAAILSRIGIFVLFWIIGLDFWILPNLFDETVPWNEAFTPLLHVSKNIDDFVTLSIRGLFMMGFYLMITEMSRAGWALEDLMAPATWSFEWGHDKLWERYHLEHHGREVPTLEDLDKVVEEIPDDAKE